MHVVELADLKLDPRNARAHDARNLQAIAESLRRFGQQKPIVIDADGVVIADNGTVEAARSLGWTSIDAVRTQLSGADAVAYTLADNRTAELAHWHTEALASLLGSLDEDVVQAIGWDAKDLAAILPARELPEDEPPPLRPDPQTRPGDIVVLGAHRLACGSCLDAELMERLMAGERADCLVTDPPYNVGYEGKTADRLTIENDAMGEEEFARFLRAAFASAFARTREGGVAYVFHADTRGEAFRREFAAAGFTLRQCLVWIKDAFVLGRQDYHRQHEPILYGWKPGCAHAWYGARSRSTVLDDDPNLEALPDGGDAALLRELREETTALREPRPRANAEHPTMKPVRLVGRLIQNSTLRGETVLDPCGGSGSALAACEHLGRRCRTVEFDPRYCDAIVARWHLLTGGTPCTERTAVT